MAKFNPNQNSLFRCIARLQELGQSSGLDTTKILTSQDASVKSLNEDMNVTNIPTGFRKSMLPVFLDKASTFYLSHGEPGTKVPVHSHDEGDGLRVILAGSIRYGDSELSEGDWMYLPKGQTYSFTVGERGVSMFYCYSCCCA